jgi:large repetitive protein
VRVRGANGYDRTSSAVIVNLGLPATSISSNGASCSNGTNFTLTSSVNDPNYTYQWYFAPNGSGPFLPVSGGTSHTLTTNVSGSYYLTYENGVCQGRSSTFNTCPILLSYRSSTVCQGGSVGNISFNNNIGWNSDNIFTLQLVDATTGSLIVNSLATVSSSTTFINVSIPNTVMSGTYRLMVKQSSPTFTSAWSSGILTVSGSQAPAAPTLTATPTSFTSGQSVTLTASNCTGTLRWADNNSSAITRIVSPSATTTYSATCTDANGCVSAVSSITVSWTCDPLEPNNTFQTATATNTATYNGPDACLDSDTDQDWYSYIHNNQPYFIRIYTGNGCLSCPGRYKLSVNISNDTLIVRTLAVIGSTTAVSYLDLYSFNGTSTSYLTGASANGLDGRLATLRYKLPAPCPQNLSLYSTILDIAPNQSNTARATRITATNKVGNGATANYFGQSSVLLSPGFETQLSTGGTFKAEVRGCND